MNGSRVWEKMQCICEQARRHRITRGSVCSGVGKMTSCEAAWDVPSHNLLSLKLLNSHSASMEIDVEVGLCDSREKAKKHAWRCKLLGICRKQGWVFGLHKGIALDLRLRSIRWLWATGPAILQFNLCVMLDRIVLKRKLALLFSYSSGIWCLWCLYSNPLSLIWLWASTHPMTIASSLTCTFLSTIPALLSTSILFVISRDKKAKLWFQAPLNLIEKLF